MMFNGLLMGNDSDTSEFTKESTGASGSECEARARCLEDSLLAAARALKNKEETVRVQAQSLALAEERLAAATSDKDLQETSEDYTTSSPPPLPPRDAPYELMQAVHIASPPCFELMNWNPEWVRNYFNKSRTRSGSVGCQVDMTDISTTSQLQDNREIVKTLQDNLSVIQELYRECFYEAARQDEAIAVLRALCRDAAPGPGVALQVEDLKSEISNFLNNSSSNDSGVWEVGELRGVEEQLRRLWAVLQDHCTCGLMEANVKLKKTNETMEIQILDLRHRVSDLQEALENKNDLDQRYQRQIKEKDEELQHIKDRLSDLERDSRDQGTECDTLACEIKQLEGMLTNKSQELVNVRQQCVSQATIITQLREELEKSNSNVKENASLRCEVGSPTAQAAAWRRRLEADSRPRAGQQRRLARHYAYDTWQLTLAEEKSAQAERLRGSLAAARAGGAALCARARAALRAARGGLRALADHARENEEIISRQELLIRSLREKTSKNVSRRSSASDVDPCCSKCLGRVERRSGDRHFAGVGETPRSGRTSTSSTARPARSETAEGSPRAAPPRRPLRKKPLCVDRRCQWPQLREASVRCASESPGSSVINREFSADCLLERVERTHEALELAHRRWCRREHQHDLPDA